jgi:hypothetical protein
MPWPCFTSGTHWIGGWVGLRTSLGTQARGKLFLPLPGIKLRSPGRPVCSKILYCLSYPTSSVILLNQLQFLTLQFMCS